MARYIWNNHREMKEKFKTDVKYFFGKRSIYIPNEIRINGCGFSFQPDGLILVFDRVLNVIFPELKTIDGIKYKEKTFFQLGKYNVINIYKNKAFKSIITKLKKFDSIEYIEFIENNYGSYRLFYENLSRIRFIFKTILIKEGKDTYFTKWVDETLPHVSVLTYNCIDNYNLN